MKRIVYLLIPLYIIAFIGCESSTDSDNTDINGYTYEVTETYTWTAENFNLIESRTINGDITAGAVFSTDISVAVTRRVTGPNEAEAMARIDSVSIDTTTVNEQLSIIADMPDGVDDYNYSAEYEILAPPDLYVVLVTINGQVNADGFQGDGLFASVNGSMTVTNQGDGATVQTVNGDITCSLAPLTSGDNTSLMTTNGDIELTIPSDAAAYFYISSALGVVELVGFSDVIYDDFETNLKSGNIGTDGAEIHCLTTIGDVTLKSD